MRLYISSGSTPAARSWPAIAWQRGDVLLKRKPPVSVRIAVYSERAMSGVTSSPSTRAKSNTSSPVAHAVMSLTISSPGGSSDATWWSITIRGTPSALTVSVSAPSRLTSLMSRTMRRSAPSNAFAPSASPFLHAVEEEVEHCRPRRWVHDARMEPALLEQAGYRRLGAAAVAIGVDVSGEHNRAARHELRGEALYRLATVRGYCEQIRKGGFHDSVE